MRRFELSEGTSNKFWEVAQEGVSLTTRWGRIGSKGQEKTKTFPSPEAAKIEYGRIIAEKVREGYREIGAASAPPETAWSAPGHIRWNPESGAPRPGGALSGSVGTAARFEGGGKFWEYEVVRGVFTTRSGAIGTAGGLEMKTFALRLRRGTTRSGR